MRTAHASAFLALVLASGCSDLVPPLFEAKLDIPDVCVRGIDVTFPPSSVAALAENPLSYTDLASGLPDDLDLSIEVREAGLSAVSGVESLDFVDHLGVRMQPLDPGASIAPVSLLDLGDDDHQADGTMRRTFEHPLDITRFLTTTDALFAFDLAGELPASTWQGTMDLCLHTTATYRKDL